ncbi:MAG TPA: hypothetical protein VMP01_21115 [Pirellulaceae bacterium]|nr:hypothetical protein [Pirellulaceae bacterium]
MASYATTAHDFGVRQSDRGHPFDKWTDTCAHWLRQQGFLQTPPR